LHRLRGVKIGKNVFIGDEVYLENEYPEAIEIQDGVQISVRAIIIAHTRGSGNVIIEKDAFIGPNTVIVTSGSRPLRIGEGAVIGAGVVVTNDVAPHMFVANDSSRVIAKALVPLTKAEKIEDFVRGLEPIRLRSRVRDTKK
jgi:acetyltransferase-like isoleucine patch superfamily enzyme